MTKERKTTWEEKLLNKFPDFNPEWSEDIQAKWLKDLRRLIRLTQKTKKDLVRA